MDQGTNPAKSLHRDFLHYVAGYVGGGAASDLTLSTSLSVSDNFDANAKGTNTAATGSYQSTGVFLLTLKQMPPTVLDVFATIRNPSGTHLRVQVLGWNEKKDAVTIDSISVAQKQVLIQVRDLNASDAAADPTTSEHIRLHVIGRESTV